MEMSETTENSKEASWSDDIILILNNLLDNIKELESIHKTNYLLLRDLLFRIRVPIIVISAINSIIAIGLNTYVSQNITSAINCFLSLTTGILGSLELFFKIQSNMDLEFQTYQNLKLLGIKIAKELKLESCNRATEGLIFLNDCISQYHSIFENSIVNETNHKDFLFEFKQKLEEKITSPKKEIFNAIL